MKAAFAEKLKAFFYLFICPIICFYGMEWYLRNPFHEKWGIKLSLVLVNLIFFYTAEFLLFGLSGSLRISLYILSLFSFLAGITDYYVYKFRGNTIVPWDFLSIGTAASVADNYDYSPNKGIISITIVFIILFILIFFCNLSIKEKKKQRIIITLSSIIFLIFAYVPFIQSTQTIKKLKVYDKLFTPSTMTMKDGTVFAFIYDMKFLKTEKPSGYDKAGIEASLASEYGKEGAFDTEASPGTPNIIVIMCEAFSDPKVLTEFKTNGDFMPFIRSLMENKNSVSGYLHVSVLGGNTPNTEFEYLTGNTMAFLPNGSIPFQQFIKKDIDALPSYLKERGYRTVANHPYNAKGWDRKRVYPLLGFDEMNFIDYFNKLDPKHIRKYISDETLFNEIIEQYKKNGSSTPLFSYNVTMQNHSEYSGELENFAPDIEIEGLEGDSLMKRYLSLQKITDSAFQRFVSYFDSISDPTVIVFFGDHQPADHVVEPLWNMAGKKGTDLCRDDIIHRYEVPYVIWANYDMEGASNIDVSANFLGNLTLRAAGTDLSGYRAFLDKQYRKSPVVSAIHTVTADGTDLDSDIHDPALQEYRRMQYYEIFDDNDVLK